jgi:hypothetical protein
MFQHRLKVAMLIYLSLVASFAFAQTCRFIYSDANRDLSCELPLVLKAIKVAA